MAMEIKFMALFSQHYLLVNVYSLQFAIENCPAEIVDLPNYKMVDLSIISERQGDNRNSLSHPAVLFKPKRIFTKIDGGAQ